MKSIEATRYVTQLTWLGIFNAFLVREDDGFTLVDTMPRGNSVGITECAMRVHMPIVRIAITHAHSDHVGSLEKLAERWPEARRFVSARDARFLSGDQSLDADERQTKLRGNFQASPVVMEHIAEGDRIGSLRVVATPGHSPGHLCFLDERDNTLLAGDAYSTLGGVATSAKTYLFFPPPGANTWDRKLAQQSAEKLLLLEPELLLTGHGKPVLHPVKKMTVAVRRSAKP